MLTPSQGLGGSRNRLEHKSLVFILNSVYNEGGGAFAFLLLSCYCDLGI